MDSYLKKKIRQDLQDIKDIFLFRFPDETGKTPSAWRREPYPK
jgi:hypothetical protein